MRTLSLWQPWSGLLVLGIKEFETRSFDTKYRGELAIHASAKMHKEGQELLDWLSKNRPNFKPNDRAYRICSVLGAVLGQVEITATYSTNNSYLHDPNNSSIEHLLGNYEPDRFFWKCENPILYDPYYPAKGMQGFWKWEKP